MAATTVVVSQELSATSSDLKWYLAHLPKYLAAIFGILVMYVGISLYQFAYGESTGLDSTEPLFKTYWHSLFYIEQVVLILLAITLWSYLWQTREQNFDALSPREELRRYINLTMWISVYTFSVYWAGSYFAEQDNSWHQAAVRDTAFTVNHIVEFYYCFPFYTVMGVSAWLYARTRLPLFAKGISLPLTLAVAGPFMIFVAVGFNEWGHTFWYREELFIAPMHYSFVIGVWFAHAVGGILMQSVLRMRGLIERIHQEPAQQY
jgi:methane/ammonia monooxygenase subunit C